MTKITISNVKQIIRSLSKQYKVKTTFSKSIKSRGLSRYWRRAITINSTCKPIEQLSVFFHELGHTYCYDNGLWQNYHVDKCPDDMTLEEKWLCYNTAIKAERWIDKWGEEEMKKHFPNLTFVKSYESRETVKQFKIELKKELCLN
jgi:hypothetical protein